MIATCRIELERKQEVYSVLYHICVIVSICPLRTAYGGHVAMCDAIYASKNDN